MAEEANVTTTATETNATTEGQQTETKATETNGQEGSKALSQEEIQKLIQSTVDTKTAELGKTIATLKKENADLKKANMTAEQLKEAEKKEFEEQKAAFELQKRQLFAQGIVAKAGYGNDVEAVVDFVISDTDANTEKRLEAFKSLVDKIVSETVEQKFKANGRVPNGGNTTTAGETKNTTIAEQLGKARADQQKQAEDVFKHYGI